MKFCSVSGEVRVGRVARESRTQGVATGVVLGSSFSRVFPMACRASASEKVTCIVDTGSVARGPFEQWVVLQLLSGGTIHWWVG